MSIKVNHPGLLTTVQDLGRHGFQKFGVIVSGAMDPISLRIANLLVGNEQGEGALEITLFGTTLEFEEDQLIAITGGYLQPKIDGIDAPMWRPLLIRKGSILQFKSALSGCRAYIAFAGGLAIPTIMGSKSTYMRAKIGGYEGRALKKGDRLTCGPMNAVGESFTRKLKKIDGHFTWSVNYVPYFTFHTTQTIRILEGAEFGRFNEASQNKIVNKPYSLTNEADRMGYRLEGETLALSEEFELLSEGVTYGTIQVPTSGQPIILVADRQTAGGYPKIGQVITADLPRLGQLQPTNKIQFEIVTLDEAEQTLIHQEQILHELSISIGIKSLS